MTHFSTRDAARKLGLGHATLARYIKSGKVPAPKTVITSNAVTHIWTEAEIEHVRQLLPKIKNGRKTRYQKQKPGARSQKSLEAKSKTKKPQPRAAVPHMKEK